MNRSGMPRRKMPMKRGGPLERGAAPTARKRSAVPSAAPVTTTAEAVTRILAGLITVAQGAREAGCQPDYLEDLAWKAAKAAALLRDRGRCQCCGRPAQVVQHRVARRMGGTADPVIAFGLANLSSMTDACHALAESRDQEMHERGFWLRSWENPAEVPVLLTNSYGFGKIWLTPDGAYSVEPSGVAA